MILAPFNRDGDFMLGEHVLEKYVARKHATLSSSTDRVFSWP